LHISRTWSDVQCALRGLGCKDNARSDLRWWRQVNIPGQLCRELLRRERNHRLAQYMYDARSWSSTFQNSLHWRCVFMIRYRLLPGFYIPANWCAAIITSKFSWICEALNDFNILCDLWLQIIQCAENIQAPAWRRLQYDVNYKGKTMIIYGIPKSPCACVHRKISRQIYRLPPHEP
jgi:hypothetical protein